MENLRYSRSSTKVYDLKGSMRNRLVKTSVPDNVYQDENLLRCEYTHYWPMVDYWISSYMYVCALSRKVMVE